MLDSFQQSFDVIAANSPTLREVCYGLRYQVYCVENPFEDPGAFPDRLERDGFDAHAVNALMTDRQTGDAIGCCRVVLPFDGGAARKLPMQTACRDPWITDADVWPPGRVGEISRFCIAKAYRKGRMIGEAKLGLLRRALQLALDNRLTHVCCLLDPLLLRLFERLGLDFGPQGQLVDHHGLRQPCVTSIRRLFAGARRTRLDVWQVVTDNGELWDTACALEAQIGATASTLAPFRMPNGLGLPQRPMPPFREVGPRALVAALT